MTTLQTLWDEVQHLPETERETLADMIWESLDENANGVSAKWAEEVKQRLDDVRVGRVSPIPAAEARRLYLDDGDGTSR